MASRYQHQYSVQLVNGVYRISTGYDFGSYDIRDPASSGPDDSQSFLGDVANDGYASSQGGTPGPSGTYVGKTADGFIGTTPGNFRALFTNTAYSYDDVVNGFVADDPSVPSTWTAVCFTSGTLVRTVRGDVAVEDLTVGDLVETASGERSPIRWIGHREVACHGRPELMPVRISAGALGENRPARDLMVSPGHAICLDVLGEVLIPASSLINGTTITQEDVESVTYWHVELDSHDILIAEGQPAESYLDMGNRGFFLESDVVDLAAGPDAKAAARTTADFCRPFHVGGPLVEVVRAQLQQRAEILGWQLVPSETWADVHLMVDGHRIEADTDGLAARFVVPTSAKDIWLVCETSVPRDLGLNDDGRRLGLCLANLTLDDGLNGKRAVALDDPLLSEGFHGCEDGVRHWTTGRTKLPAELFQGCRGTAFLRIQLACEALPRWVAPQQSEAETGPPLRLVVAA